MTVFIRSNSGSTVPLDINVDSTMRNIYDEIGGEPIFSYQGEEIKNLDESLADLGICPETTIDYKQLVPMAVNDMISCDVIIDPINKKLHNVPPEDMFIEHNYQVTTFDLSKVGHRKYQTPEGNIYHIYDDEILLDYYDDDDCVTWDLEYISKIPYYSELKSLKEQYPQFLD